jgi:hypothetical protein
VNILAEVAVAAAAHAKRQVRLPEVRRGTVTAISGDDAVVSIVGYATSVTVPNIAGAAAGDNVLVSFPSLGVAYVSAWF